MPPACDSPRPAVVVIAGPTAAGKSGAAIEFALRFGGEIVNADSMQVYRYLDLGTAKPSRADRARVPHHLIDVVPPDAPYNAGRYAQDARAAAAGIHRRGRFIFVTGGTGLYIRAFLEGLLASGEADPALREQLEREHGEAVAAGDPERLHRRLAALDRASAARIHPHDVRRIVRALEIASQEGRPASEVRRAHHFGDRPYRSLTLVLDPGRVELDARINARCAAMIEAGLLQEVRDLLDRGYGPELRPLQSIGYRHMWPVIDGSDTLANALEVMRRDTRRFARRQRAWWRGVSEAQWMHPGDDEGVAKTVEAFLRGPGVSRQKVTAV